MYKLIITGHRAHQRQIATICDSLTDKVDNSPRIGAVDVPNETSSYRVMTIDCHPSKMQSFIVRMLMAFRRCMIGRDTNDQFTIEIE